MSQRSSMKLILSLVALAVIAVFSIASGYTDASPIRTATQDSADAASTMPVPEVEADRNAPPPSRGDIADDKPVPLACNDTSCDESCGERGCEIGACHPYHPICQCFLCD
jgi:hypothetical protein